MSASVTSTNSFREKHENCKEIIVYKELVYHPADNSLRSRFFPGKWEPGKWKKASSKRILPADHPRKKMHKYRRYECDVGTGIHVYLADDIRSRSKTYAIKTRWVQRFSKEMTIIMVPVHVKMKDLIGVSADCLLAVFQQAKISKNAHMKAIRTIKNHLKNTTSGRKVK